MESGRSQRRLSNVTLTRKYHFRYMGLWMILASFFVIVLNMVLYLYVEERWGGLSSLSQPFHQEYIGIRKVFVGSLCLEAVLFIIGIVGLGMFTAHRVAGPYIRLQHVFKAVTAGNFNQDLKFRDYDRLEEVEDGFNRMMGKVREELGRTGDAEG
ncbi:MAG: methyl-accepting chemotaxis protein [Lentisphaerae bacterium]|nr:methyl-accepting chemotaxis protein [Lentisphaerota bacterium]